jgi:lysozyme family protein
MRVSTTAERLEMADFILKSEARRDKMGRLKVYPLPKADGGGTFEIAGINDRYHPKAANHIKSLLDNNRHAHAESYIKKYLVEYTDVVKAWTEEPAIESFLRDTAFNRGPKGALRILQIALQIADDGKFGPITKATLAKALKNIPDLLEKLRIARETYEIRVAPPVGARAKFWNGLKNRWDNALEFSRKFIN